MRRTIRRELRKHAEGFVESNQHARSLPRGLPVAARGITTRPGVWYYRELWKEFFHTPELARVIDPAANVVQQPVTPTEELFVGLVIAQMSSVYYATQDELLIRLEGSRRDIAEFISLPIPNSVWTKTKLLQNQDFAAFIESSLKRF